ncbi:hypothetical protein AVEN_254672-1 [Araneus ventricosus]|uniref:Uncharacterized protein n=1 Tax=Araneus ventricosus TaxID=182803 RepID=A0A4Y2EH56_ARAVE|nr:hypothetical protein AVEN_254672-1 [Araneus ventricosus]
MLFTNWLIDLQRPPLLSLNLAAHSSFYAVSQFVLTTYYRSTTTFFYGSRRVSFSSMESDQGEFDDFATPACNEAMNAAELQSERKIDNPVWGESPSTSSGYRGPASPERSQHFVSLSYVLKIVRLEKISCHAYENSYW